MKLIPFFFINLLKHFVAAFLVVKKDTIVLLVFWVLSVIQKIVFLCLYTIFCGIFADETLIFFLEHFFFSFFSESESESVSDVEELL